MGAAYFLVLLKCYKDCYCFLCNYENVIGNFIILFQSEYTWKHLTDKLNSIGTFNLSLMLHDFIIFNDLSRVDEIYWFEITNDQRIQFLSILCFYGVRWQYVRKLYSFSFFCRYILCSSILGLTYLCNTFSVFLFRLSGRDSISC